ncbi:unnamed protein product [Prorocentrum cordatum]|uniref:Uncharacterized protein n=1 Tax=Prorocentrum cordatum TaxID=2364126 RepID=A0ABN9Q4X6_9DINO|nr:unnamed protein product [Polarella glacialis]
MPDSNPPLVLPPRTPAAAAAAAGGVRPPRGLLARTLGGTARTCAASSLSPSSHTSMHPRAPRLETPVELSHVVLVDAPPREQGALVRAPLAPQKLITLERRKEQGSSAPTLARQLPA